MDAVRTGNRSTVQLIATVVGVTFLLVGILGFIPGITTDYDALKIAGPDSDAKLLGIFQVSVLHNLVHLLFGVAGLVAARTMSGARGFLIGGGAIYIVLFLLGLLLADDASANFVPLNTADDFLHLALGVVMIGAGFATGNAAGSRTAT